MQKILKIMLSLLFLIVMHIKLQASLFKMAKLNQRIITERSVKNNRMFPRVKFTSPLIDSSKRFYCNDQTSSSNFETKKNIDINQFNLIKDKLAKILHETIQNRNPKELENFKKILGNADLPVEWQLQLLASVLEKVSVGPGINKEDMERLYKADNQNTEDGLHVFLFGLGGVLFVFFLLYDLCNTAQQGEL